MPFTVLWSDTQGKDEAGLIAATNYAFACLKYYLEGKELSPGRPWIRYHSMTKRNEFLFVRSGFRDGIDEKDTLRTTRYEDTNNKTLTDGLNGIVETLKRPAEPGAGQQPDTKKRKEKTAAQKKEEEEIRNMHKVLTTLKKSMESVMMQSYNLVQKITTGAPEWAYFNNPHNLKPLTEARQKVDQFKDSSKFYQTWTMELDFQAFFKKKDNKDTEAVKTWRVEFARHSQLENLLKEVSTQAALLQGMKNGRNV